jgi:hypothetical protein
MFNDDGLDNLDDENEAIAALDDRSNVDGMSTRSGSVGSFVDDMDENTVERGSAEIFAPSLDTFKRISYSEVILTYRNPFLRDDKRDDILVDEGYVTINTADGSETIPLHIADRSPPLSHFLRAGGILNKHRIRVQIVLLPFLYVNQYHRSLPRRVTVVAVYSKPFFSPDRGLPL